MTDNAIQPIIGMLAEKHNLNFDQAVRGFQVIMNGGATPAQIAAFLMGLRVKGETVPEITAGATALRVKAAKFNAPEGCFDCCGTGGDSRGTLNISTATAFVLAACGVPVAKHGNHAVSSKSGSADVLHALGIKTDAETPVMEKSLREINIAFLLATKYHNAMRHVLPVRQELAIRTIFNLLGPLSNPAAPKRQLLGVYSKVWMEKLAHVLLGLEVERAWVVHGADGLDELTITGPTYVSELKDGAVTSFEIAPEDAGLTRGAPEELKGKDAAYNAQKMREMLLGDKTAYRDAVLLNAAAGLLITDKVGTLTEGVAMAAEKIDSGEAVKILHHFVDKSRASA